MPKNPNTIQRRYDVFFFAKLDSAPKKPAILKIVEPYSEQFIPKLCNVALPKPLTELYNPDSLHLEYLSFLDYVKRDFSL